MEHLKNLSKIGLVLLYFFQDILFSHSCSMFWILAEEAFKEFGETLKRQRQIELTEDLKVYLENSDGDPASKNQLLEEKLQENDKLYGNRIDEVSLAFVHETEV